MNTKDIVEQSEQSQVDCQPCQAKQVKFKESLKERFYSGDIPHAKGEEII
jgi:hypothetical protein